MQLEKYFFPSQSNNDETLAENLKTKEKSEPTSFVILSGLQFECLTEVTKSGGTGEIAHQNSFISVQ